MKRTRKIFALSLSALAFAYLATAIGTQVYVRTQILPKIDAGHERVARYETRILTDLKLLADKPIFAKSPREKNAERFLTGFINWGGTKDLKSLEHDRLAEAIARHPDALKSDDNLRALFADDQLKDLDLAWVDQLGAYDYLDLTTHPSFTDVLAKAENSHGVARIGMWSESPIPEFRELRYAALFRLNQLEKEKRIGEGFKLFRHVSRLMATSDSLIGAMSAVLMLHDEAKLAKMLKSEWMLIDDERIDAMKRTAWMWPGIMRLRAATGSLGPFEAYFSHETNACTWVHEMSTIELVLSDYLQPTVVFEPNLNERLERERGVFTKALSECGHPELKVFFTPSNSPLMIGRAIPNPARIPFLRRVIGLNLVAMATPNWFRYYEESPRQPASN